uniref:DUF4276 family protein n=1 Tax=Candidatus Kentrum sp. LFY TaxID=2126342 RepID=A0A450UCG1_9GAMM|nr:MAG: protein of unknown function (DUF4276) [Candidatus Kentron sp. LFY]
MIRLHFTVEGHTEKAFAKTVLAPHLGHFRVFADVRCVLTSKDKRSGKEFRGGLRSYQKAKKDILAWMTEDRDPQCRFTTMFDLFRLPDDFPGCPEANKEHDPYQQVDLLEGALARDIDDPRFIPYIQLHEFETLILADPEKLDCEYMEHREAIEDLVWMVGKENPELINSSPETAPSKRIIREIPEYDKVGAGVSVTQEIGLPVLRDKCRHFNQWFTRLEGLAESRGHVSASRQD